MKTKRLFAFALAMGLAVSGCGKTNDQEAEAVDTAKSIQDMTLDELVAAAQEEGVFETVAMADDWCNWKGSWDKIYEKYGIDHYDTDMSSAEVLAIFDAEKDDPTKDFGDVGHSFSKLAVEQDVVQAFKPSTWDSIPDWAKDPDGKWVMSYTGTIAFGVNTDLTGGEVPKTWQDIAEGDYKVTPGNVIGGAAPQIAVISCAIANGGSLDNVQPGIDFFKKLAEEGRIDPGDTNYARVVSGEIAVNCGQYDFLMLGNKNTIEEEGIDIPFEVAIPQDGAVTSGYCLVLNKYAPHPHAAAFAIEYLLSDEGQLDRAEGFARPIRSDVEIPAEIQEKMLPDEEYENAVAITDIDELTEACEEVARLWEEQVVPLLN